MRRKEEWERVSGVLLLPVDGLFVAAAAAAVAVTILIPPPVGAGAGAGRVGVGVGAGTLVLPLTLAFEVLALVVLVAVAARLMLLSLLCCCCCCCCWPDRAPRPTARPLWLQSRSDQSWRSHWRQCRIITPVPGVKGCDERVGVMRGSVVRGW